MFRPIQKLSESFVSKLILTVGLTLLLTISGWAYFNIKYQEEKVMDNILGATDRLTNTIRLGTHYAMMLNSRDDINQIIQNIGKQPEIENIRLYNKEGQIKFSNRPDEVDLTTNIKAEACDVCHRSVPPLSNLDLEQRTRIFKAADGYRRLGIISPIRNEPACSTGDCHVHPEGKKILGAMDMVISLQETDTDTTRAQKGMIVFAASIFCITSAIILLFVMRFVNQPIKRLIEGTQQIARGNYRFEVDVNQADEMGHLARSISYMGNEIATSQAELKRQRDEYQNLFEQVPCLITVQDKNYRLIRYNSLFSEKFKPTPGDFCYRAYKGLSQKCDPCPVAKTFEDGQSHYAEESGQDKDGTTKHWIVRTSPIRDADGRITAAMEISLDITQRKNLENELEKSEEKYHAIFNNIPNPVFVLDMESLAILDCNESVRPVYGYGTDDLIGRCFMELFSENDSRNYRNRITSTPVINQAKHRTKDGKFLYVNIRISPSQYLGRKVFLVTTSDITKRLETEQQLIQASKMATLGEMATGIAHELNQPLSVIKTVSSFFLKKIGKHETIAEDMMQNMLVKVDSNVDRAAKIINHMRQFARKSDTTLEKVQANDIIRSAFEIFSQQLKVRGIDVHWDIDENLPAIHADPGRLEQVFINLLLNARDAIGEYRELNPEEKETGAITLKTKTKDGLVTCEVSDTGTGLSPEIAEKIFEPFFTTKEVGKGTGLGLSISYGIVQDSGGRIRTCANQPRGTSFILEFPVPGTDIPREGVSNEKNSAPIRWLLLVDDEEDIRTVLQLPLEDLGYGVLTAENAETALKIFKAEKPAIVLTDIKMPGMDGIELLQEIKKDSPDTEVVMITGHGDMNLAIKSLKYEATDFIIKPINVDALEIALGRAEERINTREKLLGYTRSLEKLIHEKAELQDHLSSLGLLISSVSHGIKGLVTRLDGGLYLLDSGIQKNDSDQVAAGREALQQTAARIKKMVQDILYYAKKRPLNLETVNTAVFAGEVIATIQSRTDKGPLSLSLNLDRAPEKIVLDQGSMHSALISILENAVDACEKDTDKDRHRIDFKIEKQAQEVVFTIHDDGVGMDRETREKIFTLFFSSKDRHGTGLGLFIAGRVISGHKGTIEVDSEPGRGSLFRITIPLTPAPA